MLSRAAASPSEYEPLNMSHIAIRAYDAAAWVIRRLFCFSRCSIRKIVELIVARASEASFCTGSDQLLDKCTCGVVPVAPHDRIQRDLAELCPNMISLAD